MSTNEVMKISRNLCLHFAKQDAQDRKKRKENHATKVTKIPKTKRQKDLAIERRDIHMEYLLTNKCLATKILQKCARFQL